MKTKDKAVGNMLETSMKNKSKSSEGKGIKLICGNCLEVMNSIPDSSIDAIVTDPPYGLSFMGKKWDYDVPSQEIWEECLRVLKPGGYLLAFAGTRTQHRMAVRIEDAGFEIRDMIAWVYGSGFPKSLNIGKAVDKIQGNEREEYLAPIAKPDSDCWGIPNNNSTGEVKNPSSYNVKTENISVQGGMRKHTKGTSEWEGWGTALKPALEPITVARKPLEKGLNVAQNCLKWGVGGINIDGCRVEHNDKPLEMNSAKNSSGYKDGSGGGFGKQYRITALSTGRFPANLIHDGSDEVVGLFPQTKTGSIKPHKNAGSWKNCSDYIDANFTGDSGSAARFFYCAKASKSERNRGCEDMEEKTSPNNLCSGSVQKSGEGTRLDGKPLAKNTNNHPTVKPIALMEYLVKLVSKEGHTVLDPFMGSGSTGIACKKLNRNFIGIELDETYFNIARERIKNL